MEEKQGRRWEETPRTTGDRSRGVAGTRGGGLDYLCKMTPVSLSLYRLIGIAAAGRRTRPHQLLGFSTTYIIYIPNLAAGGCILPPRPPSSGTIIYMHGAEEEEEGGGGGGGSFRMCLPDGNVMYVARRAGGEGASIISQGLMKFSVNEQSTRSIFLEASCWGSAGHYFFCPRRSLSATI